MPFKIQLGITASLLCICMWILFTYFVEVVNIGVFFVK